MKYIILLLLLISNAAQAQMSCAGLFEDVRLLSEEEIEARIIELVNLRQKMMSEGGLAKSLFNSRLESLAQILPRDEIRERMRESNVNTPIQQTKIEPIQRQNGVAEYMSAVESYAKRHNMDAFGLDRNGYTLLQVAMKEGNAEIIPHLLNYGLNINAKDKDKNTALHLAVLGAAKDVLVYTTRAHNIFSDAQTAEHFMNLLLQYGADPSLKSSKRDRTELEFVIGTFKGKFRVRLLEIFANAGFKPESIDSSENTLIHKFTEQNDTAGILWLVKENLVDINVKNKEGLTALDLAIRSVKRNFSKVNKETIALLKTLGSTQSAPIQNKIIRTYEQMKILMGEDIVREQGQLSKYQITPYGLVPIQQGFKTPLQIAEEFSRKHFKKKEKK